MPLKLCQEVRNKDVWEEFLSGCEEKTFLQSWNWGEFQESLRNKIWRLGIYDNEGGLASNSLVVKIMAKRGTFLLVPHGPIIKEQGTKNKEQILNILLNRLKEIAKDEDCSFIRINSSWPRNEENERVFKNLGFRPAPIQMHPEASWKLDISSSEEELMENMRKTTRYLIKQAMKNKDIELYQGSGEDIQIFSDLHNKVSQKQKFVPFSFEYLKNEFSIFNQAGQAYLLFGKHQGKIAAGCFVVFWSGVGFYHHAALDPKYHKTSVAYLLQWEAIKEAKKRGCHLYDFWGYVDPKSSHPWAGPTLFKMGFGGRVHEYVKTQDLPLSPKYWLTYIFEKLRKIKRNL